MNSPTHQKPGPSGDRIAFWDLLSFDRLLTGPIVHIVYWCGLALVVLAGFAIVGAAVGLSIRAEGLEKLIALPALVAGVLVVAILGLLWRAVCEFYVAIFRISEDLRALRESNPRD